MITPQRRRRNGFQNYLWLAFIMLSAVVPFALVRPHRTAIAITLGLWSLCSLYLTCFFLSGGGRDGEIFSAKQIRRVTINSAMVTVFLATMGLAIYLGLPGLALFVSIIDLLIIGFVLYRFARSREQGGPADWLLAAGTVGAAAFSVFELEVRDVVSVDTTVAVATLWISLLLRSKRIMLPTLADGSTVREMRDALDRIKQRNANEVERSV